MPEAFRDDGFKFLILLPPKEHKPAHVHVEKAGEVVVLLLTVRDELPELREATNMKPADVRRARRIARENRHHLMKEWRKHHGS